MDYNRNKFEQYAAQMGKKDFELNEFGDYRNPFTQNPWDFWRASRDALTTLSDAAQAPIDDETASVLRLCVRELRAWMKDYGQDIRSQEAIQRANALLAAPVAADVAAPSEHCNLCEQAYDPECQECHTSSMATRLTEQIVIIRNLQKALAYWMPKVFDDRSAHDAYLLVGYDGEDEVGYWDQRAATQPDDGVFYELLTAYGEACHLMTNSKRITETKEAVLAAFSRATAPRTSAPFLPCPICNGVEGCDHTVPERRRAAVPQPSLPDAAITACALMIKGICMTHPQEQWSRKIEERIRCMLGTQP